MITSSGGHVTDVVATAAVTSPVWLPPLQSTSEVFAQLWPILGGIWLTVQIVRALILGWVAWKSWKSKKTKTRRTT